MFSNKVLRSQAPTSVQSVSGRCSTFRHRTLPTERFADHTHSAITSGVPLHMTMITSSSYREVHAHAIVQIRNSLTDTKENFHNLLLSLVLATRQCYSSIDGSSRIAPLLSVVHLQLQAYIQMQCHTAAYANIKNVTSVYNYLVNLSIIYSTLDIVYCLAHIK